MGVARTLLFLGFARRWAGDLDGARRAFAEARRKLRDGRVTTWLRATIGLAQSELAAGDLDAAEASFRAASRGGRRGRPAGRPRRAGRVGRQRPVPPRRRPCRRSAAHRRPARAERRRPADAAPAATGLADVLGDQGRHDLAALLLGAASLVPDEVGIRLDGASAVDAAELARRLAIDLGADELVRLQADGRMLGLEAALAQVELARHLSPQRGPAARPRRRGPPPGARGTGGARSAPGDPRRSRWPATTARIGCSMPAHTNSSCTHPPGRTTPPPAPPAMAAPMRWRSK